MGRNMLPPSRPSRGSNLNLFAGPPLSASFRTSLYPQLPGEQPAPTLAAFPNVAGYPSATPSAPPPPPLIPGYPILSQPPPYQP